MEEQSEREPRRDPLKDLEARIDAAVEEVRPKMKKVMEELDARVDSAVEELRPRFDSAMEDVRPRVDRFLADIQPRLDSALERIQAKIAELRKDLEDRTSKDEKEVPVALPRTGEESGPSESDPSATGSTEGHSPEADPTEGGAGPS